MRRRFALAGGADADVAGFLAELREVRSAEITHAGLDAADQLRDYAVHRTGNFLQRFHPFRRDLLRRILLVAVTRGRAGFHRGEAAHAAVLFVKFAADFHDLARRFGATREQAAANHA